MSETYELGKQEEHQRWIAWLERVRTWHPEKAQTYHEGIMLERTHIIQYLKERMSEMLACHKQDECETIAYVIEGIIDDIEGEAHKSYSDAERKSLVNDLIKGEQK